MSEPPTGETRLTDALCDEFEREWRAGRRPAIEEFLPRVSPAGQPALLGDLLALEIVYRLQRGERPHADEYRQRFPGAAAAVAAAFAAWAPQRPAPPSEPPTAETGVAHPVLTLTVADGPQGGVTFFCAGAGPFRVGRSGSAPVRLQDPHVSRAHFLLEAGPTGWRLTDLGGRNRTFVNERPVAPHQTASLRAGDRIRAGQTALLVGLTPPGPADGGTDEQETWVLGPGGRETAVPAPPLPTAGRHPGTVAPTTVWPAPGVPPSPAPPSRAGAAASTGSLPNTLVPPESLVPSPPMDPSRLGGYRIERELGRGGMGVVYLAVREANGTRVALKTIIPTVQYIPSQVQRFLREANILRELDHHHIVPFLEAGESDGILFFAMAYVEGTDANKMLRQQGPLPVRTAVRMICQLLSALEYAHERGFVHRDIKPANLLVAEEGGKKSVKLADFGLARAYQESRLSGLTLEGDVGGTIAFMAPEQITGFRKTQPPADQYSAAATLYTLLTGQFLFDFQPGRDRLKTVLEEDPVPLLRRSAGLPVDLAAALHRALAKDPQQRHPDVRSFRALLKAFA
jgi:serine/threonine-protein kinase